MNPRQRSGCEQRTPVDPFAPAVRRVATKVALVLLCVAGGNSLADVGSTPGKLLVGASLPLTGPLAKQGADMERGLRMGLAQASPGREIALLVKDDGGVPQRAVANARELVDAGVLALTGYEGAVAVESLLPVLEQAGVPLIGVASSAENLREPVKRLVFNLRAGAREEAAAMVTQLDTVGMTEIAVLWQDDALGAAGLEGIKVELARLAMRPVAVARVPTGGDASALAGAVNVVCATPPQALVLVLDARRALSAIRLARKRGCNPQFYAMSDAGGELIAAGTAPGELAGVVVAQVLPHPSTASLTLVSEYQSLSRKAAAPANYPGLEGFLYAKVIAEAFSRCAREPTRRCIGQALERKPLDAGGFPLRFTADDHRGSRFVEMTIVTADGRFRR
jgi:branched-chain amino acid transport system substrate-binding protein